MSASVPDREMPVINSRLSIVVIDGQTAVNGELSWSGLEDLGELQIYDLSREDQVLERVLHADVIITNKVAFNRQLLSQLPRLRYIGVSATGVNIIDLEVARERGIAVTNVPAYSSHSVAQQVFAQILSYYTEVDRYAALVKQGKWYDSPQFCLIEYPTRELFGKTIGVIGYGDIGAKVARIAEAFGMNVLIAARLGGAVSVGRTPLSELLPVSDVVTLHCPLTESTEGMVNRDFLGMMKSGALLVNTSRGGLVVEQDLARALTEGRIGRAALDVLRDEPPDRDNLLIDSPRAQITPHVAWSTIEARTRLVQQVVENLRAFCRSEEVNRIV